MKYSESTTRRIIWTLLGLTGALLLLGSGKSLHARESVQRRGISYGEPPPIEHLASLWGVNTALEQYDETAMHQALERIAAGGFHWVRQTFPWARIEPVPGQFDWDEWDRIVGAVQAHGLELVAVVDTTPPWAREGSNPCTPPLRDADLGRFVRAFAIRYGDRVHWYQIWDEPNLSDHWGDRYVDPEGYTRMLRAAGLQIRAVDPQAYILTAGLSPTWEQGPLNMDEATFLRGLYEAGAEKHFDAVAAKPYGFWSGPEDRRVSPEVLNFSRVIRLRETMVSHGDDAKPIWAVEWGWAALPPDWEGAPSPWGTDDQGTQLRRVWNAIERARLEWPWLSAMIWAAYQPNAPWNDPRWGLALVDPDGRPRQFYHGLQEIQTAPAVAYPGRYPATHPVGHYQGDWRLAAGRADIGQSGDRLQIPFRGTELSLTVRQGDYWAWLEVDVDGVPANMLPQDDTGRSYIILYDPQGREATVSVAQHLEDSVHQASIVAHGGWGQWALQGWVVGRDAPDWLGRAGLALYGAGGLLGLWAAWLATQMLNRRCNWMWSDPQVTGRLDVLFPALVGAWFLFPWPGQVALVSTGAFVVVSAWRPLWALGSMMFSLPFYMSSRPIPGLQVASLDLMGGAAIVGMMCRWAWQRQMRSTEPAAAGRGLGPCAVPLLGLAGLSLISTTAAAEKALAFGAFWRVVVLPGLLYLLTLAVPRTSRGIWAAAHAWLAGGLAVASIGLYQFVAGQGISAEGVRRVTGPYSSPNHLALFLEWTVPLALVMLLGVRRRRRLQGLVRQSAYALYLAAILVALYLTYSRAALLLALPASILFLAVFGQSRWRRWLWAAALLAVGVVIPLWGTERLDTLLQMGHGSGAARLQAWRGTLDMIAAHPLLGVGLGNFQIAYPRYMRPAAWAEPLLYHSHNVFLDFAAFLGVGGLALFLLVLLTFFRTGWRLLHPLAIPDGTQSRERILGRRERILLMALMAAAVGSLAHGLVDNGYFLPDLACLWALALGLVDRLAASTAAAVEGPRSLGGS